MKDLLAASLILLLLFGSWTAFLSFAGQEIEHLTTLLQEQLLPSIEAEQWQTSSQLIEKFQTRWKKLHRISLLFKEGGDLREIEMSVCKASKYVQAEDRSNASGELLAVSFQLSALLSCEKPNFLNIL